MAERLTTGLVFEAKFKKLHGAGGKVLVEAEQTDKDAKNPFGVNWFFYVYMPKTKELSVLARTEDAASKRYKTPQGVLSFLRSLGHEVAVVPLSDGDLIEVEPSGKWKRASRDKYGTMS